MSEEKPSEMRDHVDIDHERRSSMISRSTIARLLTSNTDFINQSTSRHGQVFFSRTMENRESIVPQPPNTGIVANMLTQGSNVQTNLHTGPPARTTSHNNITFNAGDQTSSSTQMMSSTRPEASPQLNSIIQVESSDEIRSVQESDSIQSINIISSQSISITDSQSINLSTTRAEEYDTEQNQPELPISITDKERDRVTTLPICTTSHNTSAAGRDIHAESSRAADPKPEPATTNHDYSSNLAPEHDDVTSESSHMTSQLTSHMTKAYRNPPPLLRDNPILPWPDLGINNFSLTRAAKRPRDTSSDFSGPGGNLTMIDHPMHGSMNLINREARFGSSMQHHSHGIAHGRYLIDCSRDVPVNYNIRHLQSLSNSFSSPAEPAPSGDNTHNIPMETDSVSQNITGNEHQRGSNHTTYTVSTDSCCTSSCVDSCSSRRQPPTGSSDVTGVDNIRIITGSAHSIRECSPVTEASVISMESEPINCVTSEAESSSVNTLSTNPQAEDVARGHTLYRCRVCAFLASTSAQLHAHMSTHSGSKASKCTLCDYGTNKKCNNRQHERVHRHKNPKSVLKCDKCTYSTVHVMCIKDHYLQSHSEIYTGPRVDQLSPLMSHDHHVQREHDTNMTFQNVNLTSRQQLPGNHGNPPITTSTLHTLLTTNLHYGHHKTHNTHPAQPAHAAHPAQPGHTTHPAHTTHPVQSAHPAHPAQSSHTTHPAQSAHTTHPAQPAQSAHTTHPDNPVHTTHPAHPTHPALPPIVSGPHYAQYRTPTHDSGSTYLHTMMPAQIHRSGVPVTSTVTSSNYYLCTVPDTLKEGSIRGQRSTDAHDTPTSHLVRGPRSPDPQDIPVRGQRLSEHHDTPVSHLGQPVRIKQEPMDFTLDASDVSSSETSAHHGASPDLLRNVVPRHISHRHISGGMDSLTQGTQHSPVISVRQLLMTDRSPDITIQQLTPGSAGSARSAGSAGSISHGVGPTIANTTQPYMYSPSPIKRERCSIGVQCVMSGVKAESDQSTGTEKQRWRTMSIERGIQCDLITSRTLRSRTLSYASESELSEQQSSVSGDPKCGHCGITFDDDVLYSIHIGCHSHTDPFVCNVCGKQCHNKYGFYSHIMRGHHQF